jgi:hypothetical protein
VSRDEVLDEAIAEAWGPGYSYEADELRVLFADRQGTKIASVVCDQCGKREIGSVRLIPYCGTERLIAGRLEDVDVRDLRIRRELFEHDAAVDDHRRGRRSAAVWLVEPVRRDEGVMAWCSTHGHFVVPAPELTRAIAKPAGRASTPLVLRVSHADRD